MINSKIRGKQKGVRNIVRRELTILALIKLRARSVVDASWWKESADGTKADTDKQHYLRGLSHGVVMHRVGARGRPLTPSLRTVRESFPSHVLSLSKNIPSGNVTAIVGTNVNIREIYTAGVLAWPVLPRGKLPQHTRP